MKKFDLFKLHVPEEDNSPRKWIVAYGQKFNPLVYNLIINVIKKEKYLSIVSRRISKEISINQNSVYKHINNFMRNVRLNKKPKMSIAVLNRILSIYYPKNYPKLKWELIESIEYLTGNGGKSKNLRAINS